MYCHFKAEDFEMQNSSAAISPTDFETQISSHKCIPIKCVLKAISLWVYIQNVMVNIFCKSHKIIFLPLIDHF